MQGLVCPKKGCTGVVVQQLPASEQPADEDGEGLGHWQCLACGQAMPAVGLNNDGCTQVTDICRRLLNEGVILWSSQARVQ